MLSHQSTAGCDYLPGKALKVWKRKMKLSNWEIVCGSFKTLVVWWQSSESREFAGQAIEVLNKQPSSKAKAMAYSNMSQLKMLSDQTGECIFWGKSNCDRTWREWWGNTCSCMINMGSALMLTQSSTQKGIDLLQEGLEISLKNSYHEHAARAYTAMGVTWWQ